MSRLTITHSKIASLLAVFGCRWAKCVPDFAEDAGGKPGWLSGTLATATVSLVDKETTSGAPARRRRARSPSCDSTPLLRDVVAGPRPAVPTSEFQVVECR